MNNILISASSRYPIRRKQIKGVVEKTLELMQVYQAVELEIDVVGDRKMKNLKSQYLGVDETTDVLSFPLLEFVKDKAGAAVEGKGKDDQLSYNVAKKRLGSIEFKPEVDGFIHLGGIVISYPQARRQANVHKFTVDKEIEQLVEHGMLHLLGVHHD